MMLVYGQVDSAASKFNQPLTLGACFDKRGDEITKITYLRSGYPREWTMNLCR